MEYVDLAADEITPNPGNPAHRSIPDPLMVQDIKRRGILDPLLVGEQGPPHLLYDGHRRLANGIAAGLKNFLCLKIPGDVPAEEIRLVTSLHKKDLSCPEKLHNYLALKQRYPGSAAKDLAARVSIDQSLASMYGCYENATAEVQKAFDEGKLVLKAMTAISRHPPEVQGELLQMSRTGVSGEEIVRRARKAASGGQATERESRIRIELPGGVTATFAGVALTLDGAIKAAALAGKLMKKGRDDGLTAETVQKVLRDKSKAGG
jgi:hypothetical protein